MASALQTKTLRLEITDPYGAIDIDYVATLADLPADPAPQTVYLVAADGAYYRTDKTTGALQTDYSRIELQLSDARVGKFIDLYGEALAVGVAFRAVLKRLGAQIPIVRQTAGAESVEFQSLMDLYRYYKALADDADTQANVDTGGNAGRWTRTRNPIIGGGNL